MAYRVRLILALIGVGLLCPAARGHFNMLLPQTASAKKGETVTLDYQWGHPFEHQLFDAPAPQRVVVVAPDGQRKDLTQALEQATEPATSHKRAATYRLRFTPEQRGDYVFILKTPPIWMEEEQEFLVDTVKVVLHVQAQRGWDNAAAEAMEFVPLTRPYGLVPGLVFQAQALAEAKPLAGVLVEIERYNPAAPRRLPPDEHITRTAKTDPNGVVGATLTEPGWWCLTAQRDQGRREHDGKTYPVRQRTSLWVFVDGAIRFTDNKESSGPDK
jgi:cobalt/nickel transport protein